MNPKVIAFYLPQYRPVKENNEWFGDGFTEWTNVGKAKPLFKNHYQPRVPADLGYYDLRIPEVRIKQAELAKEAGITAFCYYHYWFGNGKQILEKTLNEVVKSKQPNFPFCICWANHTWYKKLWNPDSKVLEHSILLRQEYPGNEDLILHFQCLLPAFKDERYLKVDGKLLFVIYNAKEIPDFVQFKRIWNELAESNNLPPFYFVAYTALISEIDQEPFISFDATILSLINNVMYKGNYTLLSRLKRIFQEKVSTIMHRPQLVFDYSEAIKYLLDPIESEDRVIPSIVPNWDYTPRRGAGGVIFHNSTPQLFKKHVEQAIEIIANKPEEHQILFLKSWNEWGEGNYMEPDLKNGKGYIHALRQALAEF